MPGIVARQSHGILLFAVALSIATSSCTEDIVDPGAETGSTRTYYVQAEPVAWNYMPLGHDPVYDRDPPSPWGDSLVYSKLRYIGYTDASFTTKIQQPEWMGILGPMLRGVVGDTIKVVFRNTTNRLLSIHPHGVEYTPENEGAFYQPRRGGGDAVAPGGTYTYTWFVPESAGPREGEPSSKVWLYHSHVMPDEEIYAGLEGVIVITDPAHARADGSPDDVDKEFVTLWLVFNENVGAEMEEGMEPDEEIEEMNLKHTINGYMFGNLRGLTMNRGDRVRWYLVALGTEVDLHTPHWHGERVLLEGRTYTDVVELLPASMKVGDMMADNVGTWLLHCHVGDHMMAGMLTSYSILGSGSSVASAAPNFDTDIGWIPFADRAGGAGHQH